MLKSETKKCLLLSYGPVPVPEQDKVEGGGLRIWGLAKGIAEQNAKVELTVAYKRDYAKASPTVEFEGIAITTWVETGIKDLIADYDTVIVSYCMGELSNEVAKYVAPRQQLILDCYVPIYVEISARQSDDPDTEYASFQHEVRNWDTVLRKGDIFLCANENQRRYYQGVLSAIGRVNPLTYSDELILVVPYGVYREKPVAKKRPITDLLQQRDAVGYRKILWFGAIYPWFDLRNLLEAIEIVNKTIPTKLVIVGAKNPFNTHPDFIARYNDLITLVAESKSHTNNTIFQDWIDFNDRADWYLDSDAVILVNKLGEENELAWRTRLVDYVWADLPILTNGGDPLSEKLLSDNAAVLFKGDDAKAIATQLEALLANDTELKKVKRNITKVREQLYWDVVTKQLTDCIQVQKKALDFVRTGHYTQDSAGNHGARGYALRIVDKASKIPAYYKKYGARATYYTVRTTVLNQRRRIGINPENGPPKLIFVSHQLDMTGGPLVLIDLIKDFRRQHKQIPVECHTFAPIRSENIHSLNSLGIKPIVHTSREVPLSYRSGDIVVLNTSAYAESFLSGLFLALRTGRVKHLHWYIHEDEPEFVLGRIKRQVQTLLDSGKLTIYTPAKKSTENYQNYFHDTKNIKLQYYRLELPAEADDTKTEDDFNDIRLVLPGMVGDGRKGQLPLFYALTVFKREYYDKHPDRYRDFNLTLVGMMDDFYSRQLEKQAVAALGGHFKHHRQLDHEKTLAIIKACNVTVCYSMRECLPIFVFEGMNAGHPILRNECSGLEEQLIEGTQGNGLLLKGDDFYQVVDVIERLLNKKKTTNQELARMSAVSNKIVTTYKAQDFNQIVTDIARSWGKR